MARSCIDISIGLTGPFNVLCIKWVFEQELHNLKTHSKFGRHIIKIALWKRKKDLEFSAALYISRPRIFEVYTGIQCNDEFRAEFWVTCSSIVVRGRRVKLKGNARKSAQYFPISWRLPIFYFNFLFHPIFLQVILSKTFQLSAIEVFWILSFLYCSERRPICKFIVLNLWWGLLG